MRNITLSLGGLILLLSAGCAKKPVVAQRPPDPTPVASAPVQNPAPVKPAPTKAQPQQTPVVAQAPKPASLTPEQRANLNDRLARLVDALFDYDQSTIRTDATVVLRDDVGVIRDILANFPAQKLLIEGHADERGSQEYNLALGDRRAQAVEEFLTQMGIPNTQLTLISYGKERPVCTEQGENCWQRNRRAHVTAAP